MKQSRSLNVATLEPDEEVLAYLAGYMDGEGTFTTGQNYRILVKCENTHEKTMRWIRDLFGGTIRTVPGRKANHRTTYAWAVTGHQAMNVCQRLVPYLREKTEQCLLLIAIQQLNNQGKLPKQEQALKDLERERLSKMVTALKGRIRDVSV